MASRGVGMQLHVAERADLLVDPLSGFLGTPLDDPFAAEVVAVDSRGVQRWLAQQLAHRLGTSTGGDGIASGIRFDPPSRIVADIVAAAPGVDRHDDPWHPDRLTWHVLAAIDDLGPRLGPVARHLGTAQDEIRQGRRLRLARRLSELFVSYDARRPQLVDDWAAGRDTDGAGRTLPDDLAWQPLLWRQVASTIEIPAPSQRIHEVAARLSSDPHVVDLPPRLSLFCPATLPETHLQLFAALAVHRDVHLWLTHPSTVGWGRTAAIRAGRRRDLTLSRRHRMLSSMGQGAVELELRLLPHASQVTTYEAPRRPATVLGHLQQAIADDDIGTHVEHGTDASLHLHACHGRTRQVEVLREVLVGLLADDPTLEPRDVVVLCPDLTRFAPLVETVFDPAADDDLPAHPGRSLRVRLAAPTGAQPNPVLVVLADLLAMAGSRATASALLDLAGSPPVRHRFGFTDDDVARIRDWTAESGVRWGEDRSRRERFQVGHTQGTWAAGVDRLMLGVAMAEEDQRFVGAVLPVDDVASTDVDLAGRWAELVDRASGILAVLDGARPISDWVDALEVAVDQLTDSPSDQRWEQADAARALDRIRERAPDPMMRVRLPDVARLIDDALTARTARAGFGTGSLTVTDMRSVRGVPHRVVALLGMDDGVFPRRGAPDGDDVLALDPCIGEPHPRVDDRQLFLDAVTSATQALVVVWSGASPQTGAPLPPSTPVAELLDSLDDAVHLRSPDGTTMSARDLVVHHPLQPVDPRGFLPGALVPGRPFSFDQVALDAATVLAQGERPAPAPFWVHGPTPSDPQADVDLEQLVAVLQHPVKAFIHDRLGVTAPGDVELLDDRLPLEAHGLARWAPGDRILRAALDGVDLQVAADAERRRGHLPPGELGGTVTLALLQEVEGLVQASRPVTAEPPRVVAVTADLGSRRVTGAVELRGTTVAATVFSRLGPKHRLRSWVNLLAAVVDASVPVDGAVTVGRGWRGAGRSRITAPSPDEARAALTTLLALHDAALAEPLPLPLGPSWDYARLRARGRSHALAMDVAAGTLERENGFGLDAYDRAVWGARISPTTLLEARATPTDLVLSPQETTRFGALAVALWRDLIVYEDLAG